MESDIDKYWHNASQIPSSLDIHQSLYDTIGKSDIILDFGCGEGNVISKLEDKCKSLFGFDINYRSIVYAKSKNTRNSFFICCDLHNIPFFDDSFDIGIMQAVLNLINTHHEREILLSSAYRVLRKYLYVYEFIQTWEHPIYRKRYEDGVLQTGEVGSFFVKDSEKILYKAHHFTKDEIISLITSAHFSIINVYENKVYTRSGNIINGICVLSKKET